MADLHGPITFSVNRQLIISLLHVGLALPGRSTPIIGNLTASGLVLLQNSRSPSHVQADTRAIWGNTSKTLEKRMSDLEEEKNKLEQEIANLQAEISPFSMEQNPAEKYLHIITNLSKHMNDMPEDKACEQIFAENGRLIDKVEIFQKGEREPVAIEVHRLLTVRLGNATPHSKECREVLVAGAGFEPATFRL